MDLFTDLVTLIQGAKTLFGDVEGDIDRANDREFSTSEIKSLANKIKTKLNSINKEARKNTFDFPVLFSDTIPVDLIFNFKESLENNYAQLLKIYLENIGLIRLNRDENKETFLNRIRNYMLSESVSEIEELTNDLNVNDVDGNMIKLEASDNTPSAHIPIGVSVGRNGRNQPNSPNRNHARNLGYIASQTDIDKKNYKMEPTRFTIQITIADNQGAVITENIRLGVKVHPIIVKSESILKNLPKAKFDENFFIRAARTLTREKGFFKYFLLRVDDAKKNFKLDDAWYHNMRIGTNEAKTLSKWQPKTKFANSTFIITLEEAEEMRRESKFDILSKEDSILRSMDALGIITFIVVDQARERIIRITDTYRKWEFLSFKEIEEGGRGVSDKDLLKIVLAAQGVK